MKKIIPAVISFTATLALIGCVKTPDYKRPDQPVPPSLPGATADGEKSVADIRWQDAFPDAKLRGIIALSLTNNRDLRLAALNLERARALYGIQRAELFPVINVTGGGSKRRSSADLARPGEPRSITQYDVDMGIASWEIDFFGRIRSLKEQALQSYLGAEQTRRGAQVALVAEVARAYLALAADRENLALARSTLKTQQDIAGMVRKRFDNGLATELDLRRSQVPVDAARVEIARISQQVAQDINALNLLAGAPVPEALLPADLSGVTPPRDIAPGLSSEALLKRPDILAAEFRLKAANAYISAARAAFYPRIALTTSIGTASDDLTGLFGSGTGTWSFAPRFVLPIFDARTRAAYKVSKTDREMALTQYEKAIQSAFRDVADALAVRSHVGEQFAAQEAVVDSARKILELSNQRYTQGLDGYLGVLDAQRSLYAAQQGLTILRLATLANQVRLYAVLGGGAGPQEPEAKKAPAAAPEGAKHPAKTPDSPGR